MVLTIIKNNRINANKREMDRFLERFHDNEKTFTIDCDYLNIDYINSETNIDIRHRKPAKESIYYASAYKSSNEIAYFFGLARENVVATSSYMDMGAQIRPILVAVLNLEDSSKSSIVFAESDGEYNNVVMLRIDCSQLNEDELTVLKNKNRITRLEGGKGFINFGAIGDFNTLRNIRNFISNVKFEYDNGIYAKLVSVSIPISQFSKPDSDVVKDRFYNFNGFDSDSEQVIDPNSEDVSEDESLEKLSEDHSLVNVSEDSSLGKSSEDSSLEMLSEDGSLGKTSGDSSLEKASKAKDYSSNNQENFILKELNGLKDDLEYYIGSDSDSISCSDPELYKNYFLEDGEIYLEMSIHKEEFFIIMHFLNNFITADRCELNSIEVLDMGDDILNICSSIMISDDLNPQIIEGIFEQNGFENGG